MDKLPTGIKNLDHILGGGIPLYSLNIISGAPGSGKTVFVQNIIFNNAKRGLKSLYLTTTSEPQFKMVRHLKEFDFFSDDFIGDKFIYEDFGSVLRKEGSSNAVEYLSGLIKKHKPNILAVDSFKAIRSMFPEEKAFRTFVFDLAALHSIWEITVFLVGEYKEEELTSLSEFAIADGIFHLYGMEERRFQKRYLRILKMRGTSFDQGENLFQITQSGIELFPRLKPEGVELEYKIKSGEKKGFGIQELDNMLSGGLKEGTITLLSGGTGTGKTAFAIRFLIEGAEKGEKGLYFSFEEPVSQIIQNARSLGWEIEKHIESGMLKVKFISPVEIDVDRHAYEILETVKKENIQRIVIDSITSFESSVTDLQKYKDYLWGLAQELRIRNITAIFTLMNHDLFSPLVVSKIPISSIADTIIIFRYVEDKSNIKKVLIILKSRGTNHSKELIEYDISPNGISILSKMNKVDMLK